MVTVIIISGTTHAVATSCPGGAAADRVTVCLCRRWSRNAAGSAARGKHSAAPRPKGRGLPVRALWALRAQRCQPLDCSAEGCYRGRASAASLLYLEKSRCCIDRR